MHFYFHSVFIISCIFLNFLSLFCCLSKIFFFWTNQDQESYHPRLKKKEKKTSSEILKSIPELTGGGSGLTGVIAAV